MRLLIMLLILISFNSYGHTLGELPNYMSGGIESEIKLNENVTILHFRDSHKPTFDNTHLDWLYYDTELINIWEELTFIGEVEDAPSL